MLKTWAYSTCFITGIASSLYCDLPQPSRATVRHIESKGIGYNQGYTSLDLFLSPSDPFNCRWVPFLDLRGHLFDNGDPAANAGVGLRYLMSDWIFGVNGYYDYRQTRHHHVYNQGSFGIEVMNACWGVDLRANGYIPFGDREGSLFNPEFGKFEDHFMLLRFKQDIAMRGGNVEIGYHVPFENPNVDVYFAGGSYYLQGRGRPAVGGQLRFALDLWNYVRLEANASYDRVFKWIGQGQVGLSIPFGGSGCVQCSCNPCTEHVIRNRLAQRVDRFEIIALERSRPLRAAIDPITGNPYVFWFVDGNDPNGNGTFESPFNNLISAENASSANDVIYVFPKNDGAYVNQGITLKDNQKFFGSGIAQSLLTTQGRIRIPRMSLTTPVLENIPFAPGTGLITCGNNNEISGLGVGAIFARTGILAQGIHDLYIHDNQFFMAFNGLGIDVENSTGNILIEENTFNIDVFSRGIQLNGSKPGNFIINGNQFISPTNSPPNDCVGIELGNFPSSRLENFNSLIITNNYFSGQITVFEGSAINGFVAGNGTITLARNLFVKQFANASPPAGAVFFDVLDPLVTFIILDNRWADSLSSSNPSLYILNASNSSDTCVSFSGNVSDAGYVFDNSNNGIFTLADDGSNIGSETTINTTTGRCN